MRAMVILGLLNVALVGVILVLQRLWAGGFTDSLGCDDEGSPQTLVCYNRVDWLTGLYYAEIALAALTLVTGVLLLVRWLYLRSGLLPASA